MLRIELRPQDDESRGPIHSPADCRLVVSPTVVLWFQGRNILGRAEVAVTVLILRSDIAHVGFYTIVECATTSALDQSATRYSTGMGRPEPSSRVPYLVGPRFPTYYNFRAQIQSFQYVAAPFPSDSFCRQPLRRESKTTLSLVQRFLVPTPIKPTRCLCCCRSLRNRG
jgi:hypothetical protein